MLGKQASPSASHDHVLHDSCLTLLGAFPDSGAQQVPELSVFLKEQMGTSVAECDAWK